jgi:hypothetical protein
MQIINHEWNAIIKPAGLLTQCYLFMTMLDNSRQMKSIILFDNIPATRYLLASHIIKCAKTIFANERERFDMNAKSLIGSGVAVAAVLGILAALPAQAGGGSGQIKVTHAPTPYRSASAVQPAASTPEKTQTAVNQAPATEMQVAVMANSQPAARRSVYIHR